jgi:AraC-like DNA-binding protein
MNHRQKATYEDMIPEEELPVRAGIKVIRRNDPDYGLSEDEIADRNEFIRCHLAREFELDAGEHPGWVQKMMGHETMQMIYERYYSYIKNYERDEGSAFMTNAYIPSTNDTPIAAIGQSL